MKNNRGFAQIPLMIALLLMAIAIPAVTQLVQNIQDNRGAAKGKGEKSAYDIKQEQNEANKASKKAKEAADYAKANPDKPLAQQKAEEAAAAAKAAQDKVDASRKAATGVPQGGSGSSAGAEKACYCGPGGIVTGKSCGDDFGQPCDAATGTYKACLVREERSGVCTQTADTYTKMATYGLASDLPTLPPIKANDGTGRGATYVGGASPTSVFAGVTAGVVTGTPGAGSGYAKQWADNYCSQTINKINPACVAYNGGVNVNSGLDYFNEWVDNYCSINKVSAFCAGIAAVDLAVGRSTGTPVQARPSIFAGVTAGVTVARPSVFAGVTAGVTSDTCSKITCAGMTCQNTNGTWSVGTKNCTTSPTTIPTYNPTNPVPKVCNELTCLSGQVKVTSGSGCICRYPTSAPTAKPTTPPYIAYNPTAVPTTKSGGGNGGGSGCQEQCSGSVLRNCSYPGGPESDGSSADSVCSTVGRVEFCGGQQFCCPAAGGTWTTDMTSCPTAGTAPVLKFRMAFAGIIPAAQCATADKLPLSVMVRNNDGTVNTFTSVQAVRVGNTGAGLAYYDVTLRLNDFKVPDMFSVFVKGPKHLQMKYGINNQDKYYDKAGGELTGLTTDASTTPLFHFEKYPLLAGDVTGPDGVQDGSVNGLDFTYVKNESVKRTEVAAGGYMLADLNGNCKMESSDLTLLMLSLSVKQGQLY